MNQALFNYRILDFSHVLAGPIATHFLCMQGADVIKVESGKGDTMRNYGGESHAEGMAPSFVTVNTGKRSIVLDLKDPEQLDVARKLVGWADVLVENFRPGVMERLGLGPAACKEINPALVYCSISGFGQTGPLRGNPAIDQIIQSMSGLMEVSGDPGDSPMRVGFPIVDTFTGLLAAFAITSALLQRHSSNTGQYIDIAMLDASLVMMMSIVGPYLIAGIQPRRTGNLGYSKSPTADTFPTGEGQITIGAVRQEQFEDLCRVIERQDLVADDRFKDRRSRQVHAEALRVEVIVALRAHSALEWEHRLNEAGVAAGAVRTLSQALDLDHVAQRGLLQPTAIPGASDAAVLRTGFLFAHDGAGASRPPPRLGEHTREVLMEIGCEASVVERIVGSMQL